MRIVLAVALLTLTGCVPGQDGTKYPPGYGVTPRPRHDTIEHSHDPQNVKVPGR